MTEINIVSSYDSKKLQEILPLPEHLMPYKSSIHLKVANRSLVGMMLSNAIQPSGLSLYTIIDTRSRSNPKLPGCHYYMSDLKMVEPSKLKMILDHRCLIIIGKGAEQSKTLTYCLNMIVKSGATPKETLILNGPYSEFEKRYKHFYIGNPPPLGYAFEIIKASSEVNRAGIYIALSSNLPPADLLCDHLDRIHVNTIVNCSEGSLNCKDSIGIHNVPIKSSEHINDEDKVEYKEIYPILASVLKASDGIAHCARKKRSMLVVTDSISILVAVLGTFFIDHAGYKGSQALAHQRRKLGTQYSSPSCHHQILLEIIEDNKSVITSNKNETYIQCAYDIINQSKEIEGDASLWHTKIRQIRDDINNIQEWRFVSSKVIQICNNILTAHEDPKYRKLKLSNPTIARIWEKHNVKQLLYMAGWSLNTDNHILEYKGNDYQGLRDLTLGLAIL